MDTRSFRKSKYIKSTDLQGPTAVTIRGVAAERMRNSSDDSLVVQFAEFEKALVLNSLNHDSIADLTGTFDSDQWIGKRMELYTVPEPMARSGYAVRIRALRAQTAEQPAANPKPTAVAGAPLDDNIPF
jgi:hypothetical protein